MLETLFLTDTNVFSQIMTIRTTYLSSRGTEVCVRARVRARVCVRNELKMRSLNAVLRYVEQNQKPKVA